MMNEETEELSTECRCVNKDEWEEQGGCLNICSIRRRQGDDECASFVPCFSVIIHQSEIINGNV